MKSNTLRREVDEDPRSRRGQSYSPRQRYANVEFLKMLRVVVDGKEGAELHFRITADDDNDLWAFYHVRSERLKRRVEAAIRRAGDGHVSLVKIDEARGSLLLVMLVVSTFSAAVGVVAQYPKIKENIPIIRDDIERIFRSVKEEVTRTVNALFDDYAENPVFRFFKDAFGTLFG